MDVSEQLSTFNARVTRIKDPRNDSYLDPETGFRIPKRLSKKIIKTNNSYNVPKASLGAMIMSLLLGVICVMAARYVRFQLADIPDVGTAAQTLTTMDFGIAAVLAFVLGGLVKHKSLRHMGAQIVGIGLMMVAMHNLVWLFPSEFAQVYSQAYVEQVIQVTEPLSIYVNGATVITL